MFRYVILACLLMASAQAQPRPTTTQLPLPPVPPSSKFAFCWTLAPVPGTKNMIVSNVFQTQQTESYLETEISNYEKGNNIDVTFRCTLDSQQTQSSRLQQTISSMSLQGYTITQVTVKPH